MNPRTQRQQIDGPAGPLELAIDEPEGDLRGVALLLHPLPTHGGTLDNKVVQTLARASVALGLRAVRFNFRGVGASEGIFDEGKGETLDALATVAFGRQRWPDASLWLAGFSFGGVVALRASTTRGIGAVERLITVAPALGRNFRSVRDISVPNCPWMVVQGDADEVIDGGLVIDWAEQLDPAPRLEVMPGVGHFFHGHLPALQGVVADFLGGAP